MKQTGFIGLRLSLMFEIRKKKRKNILPSKIE